LDRLMPHLFRHDLDQHDVLYPADAIIDQVYFVESGLVSLLVLSEGGDAVETGVIGSEGIAGSSVCIDSGRSLSQVVVQISGRAMRMKTSVFLEAFRECPALRAGIHKHLGYLYLQSQQTAMCHALHPLDSRLARWLLTAQDTVGQPKLDLTQEFLSHMLGSQRSSVSVCAHALQAAGLIRYRRGKVEILDRAGLEESACECYAVTQKHLAMQEMA
jgi:CRP-like cAMP-binding protein